MNGQKHRPSVKVENLIELHIISMILLSYHVHVVSYYLFTHFIHRVTPFVFTGLLNTRAFSVKCYFHSLTVGHFSMEKFTIVGNQFAE